MDVYIDIGRESKWESIIYANGVRTTVCHEKLSVIAQYIKNIYNSSDYTVYVDRMGFGIALTDELDKIEFAYKVLKCKRI